MSSIVIGPGRLDNRGVYAGRDFERGEIVSTWDLKPLSQKAFDSLPLSEHKFVHSFWGKMYLFPSPNRYTNHSSNPNTEADFKNMCDIAKRRIRKGEMITTNASIEVLAELRTYVESLSNKKLVDFQKISGGYRNAKIKYRFENEQNKKVQLRRVAGNWRIIDNKK